MMSLTALLALPIGYTGRRFAGLSNVLTPASGLLSVAFGIFLSYQIGIGGLFTANPQWAPR
jgi:high-affinity nickel-transport protein